MILIRKILKVIVLMVTVLSVPATGLFATMAFRALTTQNIGAVLVGAIFLGYFLIAASVCILLLSWVSFWNIGRIWNLILGLETGGLLVLITTFFLKISGPADYRGLITFTILCAVCGILTWGFLKRAYAQYRLDK